MRHPGPRMKLPNPEVVALRIDKAIAALEAISEDFRDHYYRAHDRPYADPGVNTSGARAPKGSHSDETQTIVLGNAWLRGRLKMVASRITGISTKVAFLKADLEKLSEQEDDFDRPLREFSDADKNQLATDIDRKLGPKYQQARSLEARMGRDEKRRRGLAREIADLERSKDRDKRASEDAAPRSRRYAQ